MDKIRAERDAMVQRHTIEQDNLHGEVAGIRYWPHGWGVSFKYHVRRPLVVDRFLGPKRLQLPVNVLVFHGKPRPIDLARPFKGNWDRFPHHGSGVVDWMRDYWDEHSVIR